MDKIVRVLGLAIFLYLTVSLVAAQQAPAAGSPLPSSSALLQQLTTAQSPLAGSNAVPLQQGTVSLTLLDAIDRGLKYNLGLILSQRTNDVAAAARLRALSEMLPHLNIRVAESVQQINLAAFGIKPAPGSSGVVGPFGIFDTRALVTENAFDMHNIYNKRAADQNVQAAKFSYQNTRDLVVLAVGASYLQALADASRVESIQAQVQTSQTIYDQAVNMKNAGMVPGIDVLRAQVQLQNQQQRLLVAQNDYDKQLLSLSRVIGLPMGQQFVLADKMPNPEPVAITLDAAVQRAYEKRSDYQQLQAQVRAAELAEKSAIAERYPTLGINGDYGVIGPTPGNSHGTFTAAAGLFVPVFQGGKIRADIEQAQAQRRTREAELADLRQRIEFEVRTAFLDVEAATKQLAVATSALAVAREQVTQARDRFAAGVTNNVEVVQAQEQQAAAEENYISSLFAHNVAKLSLARALGIAEDATKKFLGGQH